MRLKDNFGNIYEIESFSDSVEHYNFYFERVGNKIYLFFEGRLYVLEEIPKFKEAEEILNDEITAPITGKITNVKVSENDDVKKGDILMTIESMKMETFITSPFDGKVHKVYVKPNELVTQGKVLLKLLRKV